jgi:hypothetical protein
LNTALLDLTDDRQYKPFGPDDVGVEGEITNEIEENASRKLSVNTTFSGDSAG